MRSPVAFIVFKRPEQTRRVLARIREVSPPCLFVIADGPRSDRAGEAEKCAEVRALIEAGVDWPCDVRKNYAEANMGCGHRVASGLDWVFSQVEEAIILEDDCLPDASFFPFCEELLERYRSDVRVAHISGTLNYWSGIKRRESYVFSRYGSVWGWATWRRAWVANDLLLGAWPAQKAANMLASAGLGPREVSKREAILDELHAGNVHTWDYQWSFAKWSRGWLSVIPVIPLVENIGMNDQGTHRPESDWISPETSTMRFPLTHPDSVETDGVFDAMWADRFAPSFMRRLINRCRRMFRGGCR